MGISAKAGRDSAPPFARYSHIRQGIGECNSLSAGGAFGFELHQLV